MTKPTRPPAPPPSQADTNEIEAHAKALELYRERLEQEVRVAEEMARIEALLARRTSVPSRPPSPVALRTRGEADSGADPAVRARENEVTNIRSVPAAPISSPLAPIRPAFAPAPHTPEHEPWADAKSDGAIVIDAALMTKARDFARARVAPAWTPAWGAAIALLVAAVFVRNEEPGVAPAAAAPPHAEAASTVMAAPLPLLPPPPSTTAAARTGASQAGKARSAAPLQKARQADAAQESTNPYDDLAVDTSTTPHVSADAGAPAATHAATRALEEAARAAKMLRAQLGGDD